MSWRPRRPNEHPEELLSASLTGDLSEVEQAALDAHLAGCAECTRSLAEQRRGRELLGGMRHVAPPRDLAARVYAAVDAPRAPWLRRPSTLVAALATGTTAVAAVLAVLTLGDLRPDPQTGNLTPSPSANGVATIQPAASLTPDAASPSEDPLPTPLQVAVHLRSKVEDRQATLDIVTPSGEKQILDTTASLPVASSVSPGGEWIAFRLEPEGGGPAQTFVTGESGETTYDLGRSVPPGNGFGGELAWSPDGRYLAFTLTSVQDLATDAWLFDAETESVHRLTNTGDSFAATWMPSTGSGHRLWVSRASAEPVSYLLEWSDGGPPADPVDPASVAVQTVGRVFQPLVSPDGQKVIYWTGSMGNIEGRWVFQPGLPMLGTSADFGELHFDGVPLFSSLTIVGGEAFAAAQIGWGPDSNAFAVWNAQWTGVQQPEGFPDANRVYFGHLDVPELITPRQALDAANFDGVQRVVDVVIAQDGMTLAVTVQVSPGSEGGEFGAEAEIRVIERGLGQDPDRAEVLKDPGSWVGPGLFEDWDG
jgi:anti-sigma factor RsiW